MDVKVETFIATSAKDPRREVRPKLWRVRVDNRHAGFMPWKPGSKLLMHLRFAPEEMKFIEKEVARQVALLTDDKERVVESVSPSEIPEAALKEEEEFDASDFDT